MPGKVPDPTSEMNQGTGNEKGKEWVFLQNEFPFFRQVFNDVCPIEILPKHRCTRTTGNYLWFFG